MTIPLSHRVVRRFGSLQLSGMMLIALLQRTPVLRLLASAESVWVSSSFGQVLKASAVVASMLGAVDTLAGATMFNTNPEDPANATVGMSFSATFAVTGANGAVGSYTITGLPPGLSVTGATVIGGQLTLNHSAGTITGIPTQAGDFLVRITAWQSANHTGDTIANTYGINVTSADVAPAITSQPSNLTVTAGASASFMVTATGSPAPNYQWRKGGVDIGGATGSTYTIASTVSGDAGTYTVFVSNGVGNGVTSTAATLTVNPASVAPSITSQPADQTVTVGQQASFSVGADGTAPLSYQWRKNEVNIGGATGSTYTIGSTVMGDAGTYSVVVTNSVNSVTSTGATLTVNAAVAAPAITTQPLAQTINTGGPVTFVAAASGNPAPTYQWQKNGVNIAGATNSSYTIVAVVGGDSGNYAVVATNSVSSASSNSVLLTVIVPPSNAIVMIAVE